MPEIKLTLLAMLVAQATGAAVIGTLLWSFYRSYAKNYLLQWIRGWFALSVFLFAMSGHHLISARSSVDNFWAVIASLIGCVSGYVHVAWMVSGSFELARQRRVRLRDLERLLIALATLGIVAALVFPLSSMRSHLQYLVQIGVRSLIAGSAFVAVAYALWRSRGIRGGLGFSLFSAALAVYGAFQLLYVVLGTAWVINGSFYPYAIYLGAVDFILQSIVGLGMIVAILEDEREAAVLAASQIEHLAYHDALTGLPNRALFFDRVIVALAQAERYQHKSAVFFVDLDRFKEINDSLGHSVGDAVLKTAARRIRECILQGDTVARFGGDEFALLVSKIDHIEDAAKIAQKVTEITKVPFIIGDREMVVTTSVGISIFPDDGREAETLVKNADTAMYRAKDFGRDNYQMYTASMNSKALERLELENRLRKALTQGELEVFYQPLIDLERNAVYGFEALLRWRHPELGMLSPEQFLATAEISGLIVPIGEWVLAKACMQGRVWQEQEGIDLIVSVNLSARQFQHPDLLSRIKATLAQTGLRAEHLELEITESHAMQNAEQSIRLMREFKELGVRLAIDDFGTGYSSLSYLKRFPIDTLKLDQSFVRDITSPATEAIVTAVITMAHSLGLKVIAEGVETDNQLSFLKRHDCDRIQGYLFSAPLSAIEFEKFLAESKPSVAMA